MVLRLQSSLAKLMLAMVLGGMEDKMSQLLDVLSTQHSNEQPPHCHRPCVAHHVKPGRGQWRRRSGLERCRRRCLGSLVCSRPCTLQHEKHQTSALHPIMTTASAFWLSCANAPTAANAGVLAPARAQVVSAKPDDKWRERWCTMYGPTYGPCD